MGHTVLDLIAGSSVQVDELQRGGNVLLELLATKSGSRSILDEHKRQRFLKVVTTVDAMRSAASGAEGMFQQIQPMISPQPHPANQVAADGAAASSNTGRPVSGNCTCGLWDVVQRVRLASGLELTLVAWDLLAGSVLKHPIAQAGAGPDCCTEVHLRIPGVLHAAVALSSPGSYNVLHVGVHADTPVEVRALAWKVSDNLVFQRVSSLAIRALNHFRHCMPGNAQRPATEVLEDMLLWLCSYRDLFTRPCEASQCLLAADPVTQSMLPPVLRPYRLSHPALVVAASARGPRHAFHLQSAPAAAL